MTPPWEVLGLAPDCTQKELRDAYARLLKQHRPDKDPEGFRRVRDAYEWMREHVEKGSSVPSDIAKFLAGVEQKEAVSGEAPSEATANQEVPAAAASAPAHENPQWRPSFDEAQPVWDDDEPSEHVPPVPAATHMTAPVPAGAHMGVELMKAAAQRGDWDAVQKLVDGLELESQKDASPHVARALVLGAMFLAIIDWRRAQNLANAAFPHLSEEDRNTVMRELEYLIQAGRELMYIPLRNRRTLARCLARDTAERNEQEVVQAFQNLAGVTAAHTAKAYFAARFPDLAQPHRVTQRVVVRRPAYTAAAASSSSSNTGCSNFWWLGVVVMLVIRGLSYKPMPSRTDYAPRYTPPPAYSDDDLRRSRNDINEILKKAQEQKNQETRERNSSRLLPGNKQPGLDLLPELRRMREDQNIGAYPPQDLFPSVPR